MGEELKRRGKDGQYREDSVQSITALLKLKSGLSGLPVVVASVTHNKLPGLDFSWAGAPALQIQEGDSA